MQSAPPEASLLYCPVVHATHADAPTVTNVPSPTEASSVCDPTLHAMQLLELLLAVYCPTKHASQLLSPVGLCLPATQLLQVTAPVVTAYAPLLELWLAVYCPDPHAEQAILPELVLYRPASQLPQTRFAVGVQADVWPMPAEHVVHAEQSLLPELVLYLPVSQLTHVVAVPSAAVPLSW